MAGGAGVDGGLQEEASLVKGGRKKEGGGEMEGIPGWGGSQERPGVREAPQAAASELGALHHGALTGALNRSVRS